MATASGRDCVLDADFLDDLRHWVDSNPRIAGRILSLVDAVLREPFAGIGKPEPLKHLASGTWSRRITGEHRLVYRAYADRIHFVQARYHY